MKIFKIRDLIEAVSGRMIQGNINALVNPVSIDSRTLNPGDLFFALAGPNFDGYNFIIDAFGKGASGIVISKKINFPEKEKIKYENKIIIEVEDTLKALQDWAKFFKKEYKTYNVCVTGSTGKTTTKELIASILALKYSLLKTAGNYNNEIGIPLTLFKLKDNHKILITEMGMRGLGEIKDLTDLVKPDLAIVTNIGESHIGLLGSKDNIFRAKSEILTSLNTDGIAVLNRDDSYYFKMRELVKDKRIIAFGIKNISDIMASDIKLRNGKGMKFNLKIGNNQEKGLYLPLLGIHNIYNVLAASAVAFALGIDRDLIIKGLASFKPIPMHMHLIDFYDDIKIVNDSYNASPSSVKSALLTFTGIAGKNRKIVILGDMLELGEMADFYHKEIGREIVNSSIDILITLGDGGKLIAQSAIENGMQDDCVFSFRKENREKLSLKLLSILNPMDFLLLKASREMEMEKIQKFIQEKFRNRMK